MSKTKAYVGAIILAILGIWMLMAPYMTDSSEIAVATSKFSTGVASFFVVAFAIFIAVIMIWAAFNDRPWLVVIGVAIAMIYFLNQKFAFASKFLAGLGNFISAPFTKLGIPSIWQTIFAIVFLLVAGALFAYGHFASSSRKPRKKSSANA